MPLIQAARKQPVNVSPAPACRPGWQAAPTHAAAVRPCAAGGRRPPRASGSGGNRPRPRQAKGWRSRTSSTGARDQCSRPVAVGIAPSSRQRARAERARPLLRPECCVGGMVGADIPDTGQPRRRRVGHGAGRRARRAISERAARSGTKPSSLIAASILARVSGRTPRRLVSTLDTVPMDTPASVATSRMVGRRKVSPGSPAARRQWAARWKCPPGSLSALRHGPHPPARQASAGRDPMLPRTRRTARRRHRWYRPLQPREPAPASAARPRIKVAPDAPSVTITAPDRNGPTRPASIELTISTSISSCSSSHANATGAALAIRTIRHIRPRPRA